jgi:protein tyrosine/serine phosphatase
MTLALSFRQLVPTLAFVITALTSPQRASAAVTDITRFSRVSFDLYRGGQPIGIQFQELRDFGIKTVISLVEKPIQVVEDERKTVEELGMNFHSFPIATFKGPSDQTLQAIFDEMLRPENFPVFLHCKHGKDRTGMITGLYRIHAEYRSAEAAYREMKSFGYNPLYLGLTWKFWTHSHPGDIRIDTYRQEAASATP